MIHQTCPIAEDDNTLNNKNMIKSFKFLLIEKCITLFFGFITSAILMKELGPSDNAIIAQALGVAYLCSSLVKSGLDDILQDKHQKRNHKSILSTRNIFIERVFFIIVLIFIIKIFSVDELISVANYPDLMLPLFLFSVALVIDFGTHFLRGQKKNSVNNIVTSLLSILLFLSVWFGTSEDKGLSFYLYAYALIYGVSNIVLIILSFYFGSKSNISQISIPASMKIRMFINATLAMLYFRVDAILLPEIIGSYEAGRFLAAQRVSDILPGTFVILASISLPWSKKAFTQGSWRRLFVAFAQITTMLCLLAFIPIILLYHYFLLNYLGDAYRETSHLITIFSVAIPPLIFGAFMDINFILNKQLSFIVLKTMIAVCLKIIFLAFTVPETELYIVAAYTPICVSLATYITCLIADKNLLKIQLKVLSFFELKKNLQLVLRNAND